MSTYEASRYAFPSAAITSGTFADARLAASNVTQHVTATTNSTGPWTPAVSHGTIDNGHGLYRKVGNLCFAVGRFRYTAYNDNTSRFTVNGLPFTSIDSGNIAGGGHCLFGFQYSAINTVVRNNSTSVESYTGGAEIGSSSVGTSGSDSYMSQYPASNPGEMISAKQLEQSALGTTYHTPDARYVFIYVTYSTAS